MDAERDGGERKFGDTYRIITNRIGVSGERDGGEWIVESAKRGTVHLLIQQ